jgi:hypothetical protein
MTDRRRRPRYVLNKPLRGDAMPMQDVTLEQFTGGRAVVIASSPHSPDEEVVIHLRTPVGLQSQRATVLTSAPVTVAGSLCYRVELRVRDEGDAQPR